MNKSKIIKRKIISFGTTQGTSFFSVIHDLIPLPPLKFSLGFDHLNIYP